MIPDETVYRLIDLHKWANKWARKNEKTINLSGYFQKCLNILIETQDPEYFATYMEYAELPIKKKAETTPLPQKLFKIPSTIDIIEETESNIIKEPTNI